MNVNLPMTDLLPAPEDSFPHPFGRYTLEHVLGRGAMGTVFLAYDTHLERRVALKVPHPHLLEDAVARQRFYREARSAARLRHPNLCPVLDLGEHEGKLFVTTEYIPGQQLGEAGWNDVAAATRLVHTLATALAEAHRLNVIHRDLKPSNILITPAGTPVVVDFGLALRLDADDHLTEPGVGVGSLPYAAPEQREGNRHALGPACDVYSLGAILYQLLTGRVSIGQEPDPPSLARPGLDARLEAICLRALAWRLPDRFAQMDEFAAALGRFLEPEQSGREQIRSLVPIGMVRWLFVGLGERATVRARQDRLFLDVGNDLGPGVLDHHQLLSGAGSTAGLVLDHPGFIDATVRLERRPNDPFTIVLHEQPDLDAVGSSFLALHYLAEGTFPSGAELLRRYLDAVDRDAPTLSAERHYTLHAAYLRICSRLMERAWNSPHEQWHERVRSGQELIAAVVDQAAARGCAVEEVDAFVCSSLLGELDRAEIAHDRLHYERKLVEPRHRARMVRLSLPGRYGGRQEVDALLVRDVQNAEDPDRCMYFKDWARSDVARSPNGKGFIALCIFTKEGANRPRRAIVSTAPDSGVCLRGLAAMLEEAESRRRQAVYGVDDRAMDLTTGQPRVPRPGYANADPWYDGRGHEYTIVDAPRAGTMLTAEEVEGIVLQYGGAAGAP